MRSFGIETMPAGDANIVDSLGGYPRFAPTRNQVDEPTDN